MKILKNRANLFQNLTYTGILDKPLAHNNFQFQQDRKLSLLQSSRHLDLRLAWMLTICYSNVITIIL